MMEIKTNITWGEWYKKYSSIATRDNCTLICDSIKEKYNDNRSIMIIFETVNKKEKWIMYDMLDKWK